LLTMSILRHAAGCIGTTLSQVFGCQLGS
jgi:hypothetical protein